MGGTDRRRWGATGDGIEGEPKGEDRQWGLSGFGDTVADQEHERRRPARSVASHAASVDHRFSGPIG